MSKTKKAEQEEPVEFECGILYLCEPRFEDNMLKRWEKLGLSAEHVGWVDGEKQFRLSGAKEALLKFWDKAGWNKVDVLATLKEVKQ